MSGFPANASLCSPSHTGIAGCIGPRMPTLTILGVLPTNETLALKASGGSFMGLFVDFEQSSRRRRTLSLLAMGVVLSTSLSSCGKGEITANTTCKDYYSYDSQTRHDAAIRLSAEVHSSDAGNPMWGLSVDSMCGGSPGTTLGQILTPKAAAAVTPDATATEEATATPTATATYQPATVDPAQSIGQVVLTSERANLACSSTFPSGTETDSTSISSLQLLAGGKALLTCKGGVLGLDLFSGQVLWQRASAASESIGEALVLGQDHLFVVQSTDHPASGLVAEFVTREISAIDLKTGADSWTQPLEEAVPKSERDTNLQPTVTITETPSSPASSDKVVAVQLTRFSAFDAATGTPQWDAPEVKGTYVGLGISLDTSGNDGPGWTGYDAKSGKVLWQKQVPEVGGSATVLEGTTIWQMGSTGVLGVDALTGRMLLSRLYPESWTSSLVTPTLTAASTGKGVQLFKTTDLRHPLWSAAGDSATPVAVTPDLLIVSAASGLVALDAHTGEIRTDVTLPATASSSEWQVTDGLSVMSDSSVFELSPPSGGSS